jgi:hypothetical protein
MTMLERRYPEEFGRRVALEHGGEVGVMDFAAVLREARRRADAKRQAQLVDASSTAAPPPPPVELLETPEESTIPVEGHPPLAAAPPAGSPLAAATCGDVGSPAASQDTESEAPTSERDGR